MKAAWETRPFEKCIEKVAYTTKIPRKAFLEEGSFPIVSQEDRFINGYWNNEADVFRTPHPVVVFGDHTKTLKFIDFDFVLGADGVKVLQPKTFLEPKFFFYQLQTANLVSLGYARHYKLLKELDIKYPPLPEQRRIVGILDEAFEGIAKAVANVEANLNNARELFESHLNSVFSNPSPDWVKRRLGDICTNVFAGGDVPKENHSKTLTEKHQVPIYTNGEKNNGLYGYTDTARVTSPSITISARGTIGYTVIRNESFYPAIRLIVATPNQNILDLSFLYFAIENMSIGHSGTSIPQLTVPMVREFLIPVPTLAEQRKLADQLYALHAETKRLETIYRQKLALLVELKQSLLQKAFSGEL